jgi:hypothetical protein
MCRADSKLEFGGAIVTQSGFEITYLQTLRAETRSSWSAAGPDGKPTALAYCH